MNSRYPLGLVALLLASSSASAQGTQFRWLNRCSNTYSPGGGLHTTNTFLPVTSNPFAYENVIPFDWDNDNDVDILTVGSVVGLLQNETSRASSQDPSLFNVFSDASGQVYPGMSLSAQTDAAVADFDQDGDLDVAIASRNGVNSGNLLILSNKQSASGPRTLVDAFTTNWLYGATGPINSILAEDFNGDGVPDLVVAGGSGLSSGIKVMTTQNFDPASDPSPPYTTVMTDVANPVTGWTPLEVHDLAAGDLDGDGDMDIAFAASDLSGNPAPTIGLNDGEGRFTIIAVARIPNRSANGQPTCVALGDTTGNGYLDMVLGHAASFNSTTSAWEDGQLEIYMNAGTATLRPLGAFGAQQHYTDVVVGDLDEDGVSEIIASGKQRYQNSTLLYARTRSYSRPAGSFGFIEDTFARFEDDGGAVSGPPLNFVAGSVALADLDLDLDLDVIVGHGVPALSGHPVLPGIFANHLWQLDAPRHQSVNQQTQNWELVYELFCESGIGAPIPPTASNAATIAVSFAAPTHVFPSSPAGTLTAGGSWIFSSTLYFGQHETVHMNLGPQNPALVGTTLYSQALTFSYNRNEVRVGSVLETTIL